MQTEFPRDAQTSERTDDPAPDVIAPAGLTDDDLDLIDLRYDQFVAQAELDRVRFDV